jgi:hypothetical protein
MGTPSPTPLSLATSASPVLEEGMSVFANKEMGVVRFIGTTEFADGVWLGIELRKPSKSINNARIVNENGWEKDHKLSIPFKMYSRHFFSWSMNS